MNTIKDIIAKRRLIFELAKADFKKRFVGSYFGIVWLFLQPTVTVVIYFMIFQLGFKSTPVSDRNIPYVIWMVAGLVPWFFFNEAVTTGTNSLREYSFLVKKIVFQVDIIPVVKITSAFFVHLIFLLIAIVLNLFCGVMPSIYWLQLPLYSLLTALLGLGVCYATAAVDVFFKDMGQIVGIILQVGIWATPIMWKLEDMAPAWSWPIFRLNPMFFVVDGYRDAFIFQRWFWEKPGWLLYTLAVTAVLLFLGNRVFKKLRPHFADVM